MKRLNAGSIFFVIIVLTVFSCRRPQPEEPKQPNVYRFYCG